MKGGVVADGEREYEGAVDGLEVGLVGVVAVWERLFVHLVEQDVLCRRKTGQKSGLAESMKHNDVSQKV